MRKIISILMAFALVFNLFGKSFGNNQKLQKNVDETNIYESHLNKKTQKMNIKAIDALSKKLVYADSIDLSNIDEEKIRNISDHSISHIVGFGFRISTTVENGIQKRRWYLDRRDLLYLKTELTIIETDESKELLKQFEEKVYHAISVEKQILLKAGAGAFSALIQFAPKLLKMPPSAILATLSIIGIVVATGSIVESISSLGVTGKKLKDLFKQLMFYNIELTSAGPR